VHPAPPIPPRHVCASGLWRSWFGALLLVLLAGCAGYRLGPTNGQPAGSRSVQVNPFQNKTLEPRFIEPVTTAFRKRFQQDGTFKLATHDDGDIIVSGVITRFERSAVSFQASDILTPRDMDAWIYAHITAEERGTGKKLLDRTFRGRTTVRVEADFSSAERQALPLLADDLARVAVAALVDGTW